LLPFISGNREGPKAPGLRAAAFSQGLRLRTSIFLLFLLIAFDRFISNTLEKARRTVRDGTQNQNMAEIIGFEKQMLQAA
jgi:hypothetical protein